jgi:hypothetical protein
MPSLVSLHFTAWLTYICRAKGGRGTADGIYAPGHCCGGDRAAATQGREPHDNVPNFLLAGCVQDLNTSGDVMRAAQLVSSGCLSDGNRPTVAMTIRCGFGEVLLLLSAPVRARMLSCRDMGVRPSELLSFLGCSRLSMVMCFACLLTCLPHRMQVVIRKQS